jgi:MYXO-CTERM domain-containing protein
MHKNKSLLAALFFLPFVAQAASSASFESAGCTGSLSSSLGEEAFLLCSGGDLSLRRTLPTGSGSALQISPGGDISLTGGGRIVLISPGGIVLQYSGGGITGAGVDASGGNISLSGRGGILTLASPVPEPGATSMMLVGLLVLLGVGVGRKRRGSGLLT